MASEPAVSRVFEFSFQRSVYRLEVIKKASYRFLADYDVHISEVADTIQISLIEKEPSRSCRFDARQFPAEVLDQDLREQVLSETQAMRDLILAQAFSSLSLLDALGETADFREDPLSIARPDRNQGT